MKIKHKIRVCLPWHKGTLPGSRGCEEHTVVQVPLGAVQIPLCIAVLERKGKGNFPSGQNHGIVCFASSVLSEWPAESGYELPLAWIQVCLQ